MFAQRRIDLGFLDEQSAPCQLWDAADALRLIRQADELVIRLGVPSTHPVLQAAAERAVVENDRHDMAGVRAAVTEVENLARRLAGSGPSELGVPVRD